MRRFTGTVILHFFPRKHRELKSDSHIHQLLVDTLKVSVTGTSVSGVVRNLKTKDDLSLEIYAVKDRTIRVRLNELNPSRQRYDLEMSLDKTPDYVPYVICQKISCSTCSV